MKNLRNISFSILLLAMATVFVTTSCDDVTDGVKQTINFNAADIQFSIDSITFNVNKSTADLNVVYDEVVPMAELVNAVADAGFSMDNINSLTLAGATLRITTSDFDVNYFNAAQVYLGSETNLVAEILEVDEANQEIILDVAAIDVLSYLSTEELRVIVVLDADGSLPTSVVDVELVSSYSAEVEIL